MLSTLAFGDLIATNACYHKKCLTDYSTRHRAWQRQKNSEETETRKKLEDRAFLEVISFLEESITLGKNIFLLQEILKFYVRSLHRYKIEKSANVSVLKNKILDHFQGRLLEHSDGYRVVLISKCKSEEMVRNFLMENDYKGKILTLAKAADIVRNEMFSHLCPPFNGAFSQKHQQNSVPKLLLKLVSFLLDGQQDESEEIESDSEEIGQVHLSIAQLLFFNASKTGNSLKRHSLDREPPLPL
eukprot:Pompholyxophrys_punicea_v1_NODE_10_length_6905_cov_7.951686.p4 type:complete len:243 gc:universal NODE_10_length_6905_cov_7.951686:6628-5900(-)